MAVDNPECTAHTECITPGACGVREGATCISGRCSYPPLQCDTPPSSECSGDDATLYTYGNSGTCAQETGLCVYPRFETPCPGCAAGCLAACAALTCPDENGGCRTDGRCVPTPAAHCVFDDAPDAAPCDPPGANPGAGGGVCDGGVCVESSGQLCTTNGGCAPETCIGGTCRPPAGVGVACDPGDTADCGLGLDCVAELCRWQAGHACLANVDCAGTCVASACAAPGGLDAACDLGDASDCQAGYACVGETCLGVTGTACTANDDCAGTCVTDLCAALSPPAGPCDTADNADCEPGMTCAGNTCRLPIGALCTDNAECLDTCIGGQCAALAGAGTSCDAGDDLDCTLGNLCIASVCLSEDGQSCAANASCIHTCIGNVCGPLVGTNQTCDAADSADCVPNHTCVGTACKRNNQETCAANNECAGTCLQLECADRSGLNGACDGGDNADCAAGFTCVAGVCKRTNGQGCDANAECAAGQCECTNAGCGNRVCTGTSCTCRYGAGGACTSAMTNGVDDPEDCTQSGRSCHQGACRSDNAGTCGCDNCLDCASNVIDACGFGWNPNPSCACGSDAYGNCFQTANSCSCVAN